MSKKNRMFMVLAAGLILCMMVSVFLTGCKSSSSQEAPAEEPAQAEEPAAAAEPEEPAAAEPEAEEKKEIGEDKALEIALKDAGLSESDITNKQVHLDVDDGRTEYDVEFYQGTTEYGYNIDAYNGDILEKDIDNDND